MNKPENEPATPPSGVFRRAANRRASFVGIVASTVVHAGLIVLYSFNAQGWAALSGRVSVEAPDFRFSRPQRLAVREPADLRIETLAMFGQIAAILVTDGAHYQLWSGSIRRHRSGKKRRRRNLSRLPGYVPRSTTVNGSAGK